MRLLGTLTAADEASRLLTYRLLPFGEPGYTNVGRVVASAGVLQLCAAKDFVLNLEHDRHQPLAVGTELSETAAGVDVTVRVLATRAGDDLLVEAHEGVRSGCSVEVDDPVVRGGHLLGGAISGGAAVVDPAFISARLVAGRVPVAPDEGDDTDTDDSPDTDSDADTGTDTEPVTSDDDSDTDDTDDTDTDADTGTDKEGSDMTTDTVATAPKLAASRTKSSAAKKQLTAAQAFQAMSRLRRGDSTALAVIDPAGQLFAALDNFTEADGDAAAVPQWVGEVWSGQAFQRVVIPVLSQQNLTSLHIHGYRWVLKPTVAKYTGLPAEINSTDATLEPVDEDATRWAGGGRIDRRFTDFNDQDVISAYIKALAEDYARKTDSEALALLLAGATTVLDGPTVANVPIGLARIVDGALAVMEVGTPSWAFLAADIWREMVLVTEDARLAFLSTSLGLDAGTVAGFSMRPHPEMPDGSVLVGCRPAATHYELPGSPIRVNAQAIAVGAIDEAVFGYDHVMVNDARGLALVEPPVTPFGAGMEKAQPTDPGDLGDPGDPSRELSRKVATSFKASDQPDK